MMLALICTQILDLSLTASLLALCILALRKITQKHVRGGVHYLLWLMLIVRLVMPFSFESKYNVMNLIKQSTIEKAAPFVKEQISEQPSYNLIIEEKQDDDQGVAVNPQSALVQQSPMPKSLSIGVVLSVVWFAGVLTMLSVMLVSLLWFRIQLKGNTPCTDLQLNDLFVNTKMTLGINRRIQLVHHKNISGPAIFSLWKPMLMIPQDMAATLSAEDASYVFLHELFHYKRKDLFILWLVAFLRALHWFNPILWYAFYIMEQDLEEACDADVLKQLSESQHKNYGLAIIKVIANFSQGHPYTVNVSLGRSANGIKRRIIMISKFTHYKKRKASSVLLLVMSLGLIIAFLTSPVTPRAEVKSYIKGQITAEYPSTFKSAAPTAENTSSALVQYDKAKNAIVLAKHDTFMSLADVQQNDRYWDKTYVLTVDGTSKAETFAINNDLVESIVVESKDNQTSVTILGKQIIGMIASEDEQHVYFTPAIPAKAYDKIVVLDPGHGGADNGAANGSLIEKDLNLALAKEVALISEGLADNDIKVYLTRQSDAKLELAERTAVINELGGVAVIIHYNSAPPENRSDHANGTMSHYFAEDSESRILAGILQNHMTGQLGTQDRGVTAEELYVLKHSNVPAAEISPAFITDEADIAIINTPGYTQKAALALLNGIRDYFGEK